MDKDTGRLKAVLVFTAALAFAVSPTFAPDFRGFAPDAFPVPQPDPPVQPAGYAFAIWGLIWLWLLVHGGWGLFARADDPDWDAARWPVFGSLALGASWLSVAGIAPVVATVQIWIMLGLALRAIAIAPRDRERLLLAAPLALYAGWLTAASWAALGVVLGGYGVLGDTAAAVLCLAGAVALGIGAQVRMGGLPLYGAGLAWGLAGIAVANVGRLPLLALAAALGTGVVAVMAIRVAKAKD